MPKRIDKLLIATHNEGKLEEIRQLLAMFGVTAISAGDLGLPAPEETGASFAGNAEIKAKAAAQSANMAALADDSGLCVDALAGGPGVHSARWAGPSRNFNAAIEKVEAALRKAQATQPFKAYFTCALALAWPNGGVENFEGKVFGQLVFPPRGTLGFGYDPIFLPDGFARTFGEMTSEEKHGIPRDGSVALSHRARAFRDFARTCLDRRESF